MCVQFLSCFCKLKQKISLFDLLIYCKLKTTNAVTIAHVRGRDLKNLLTPNIKLLCVIHPLAVCGKI